MQVQGRSSLREAQPGDCPQSQHSSIFSLRQLDLPKGSTEIWASEYGEFPKELIHLPDVGKEGNLGSRSRAQSSNLNPFLCYFTARYQRRIFDKTRQNSQGKKNSYLLLPLCGHPEKLKSCNCSTCISLQRGTICVLSNNKAQL